MANCRLYRGGKPNIIYGMGARDPYLNGPPFAPTNIKLNPPIEDGAPFDAHYAGALEGQRTYPAGFPFGPRLDRLKWQLNNLMDAQPGVGDIIEMIVVPTNHYIEYLRFDVCMADANMLGATVAMTGVRYRVDNTKDPYRDFTVTEDPDFAAAATAQGIADIPLDVPSSTFLSLLTVGSMDINATAPSGGGAVTVTSAGGYAVPKYVEPEFLVPNIPGAGPAKERFQTGALVLGIKIKTNPTDAKKKIWDAGHSFYLTTRISGFDSPNTVG